MGVKIRQYRPGQFGVYVCHRRRRSFQKIGPNKKHAVTVANGIRKDIESGNFSFDRTLPRESAPTLSAYFKTFEKGHMKSLRPSTQDSYYSAFNRYIEPHLGSFSLADINRRMVKNFIDTLKLHTYKHKEEQRPLSKDSVRIITSTLRKILNEAVDDELIAVNPAQKMGKRFRELTSVHEVNPLTQDQTVKFLEAAAKETPYYFALFACLLHAGLRVGEAVGLHWTDVDFKRKVLNVCKQGAHRGKTKTGKTRMVEISDFLLNVLMTLKKQRQQDNQASPFVFCSQNGTAMDVHNLRFQQFNKVLLKAGLRKIRVHDLRHTYATLHLAGGSPLQWVSKQLGHASVVMTCDVYYHFLPDATNRQVVNSLPSISEPSTNNLIVMAR